MNVSVVTLARVTTLTHCLRHPRIYGNRHTSMASETGCNSNNAATSTAEASSYEYLKDFYEQISTDSNGKNLTFLCKLCPLDLKKQVRTSATSTTNLKRHIELKHPTSLGKYLRVNDDHHKKVAVCRRRWKGLRDTYSRECKKEMMAIKSRSEAAGSRKKWKYTDDLAFLNPLIKGLGNMEQHGNTGYTENSTGEGDHGNTEPVSLEDSRGSSNSCAGQPAEIEVKTEDIEDEPERESTVDHGMVNCVRRLSEPTVKQSSAELFCRSIVPHLERLPLEKLIKIQIQILQIVQDAMGS